MEEENGGLTFRDICKTIWLRKWVALIVAVAVALVCSVSLYYGYNRHVGNYVMEFSLNLPGDDNGVVYIYPNGSQLYYADMTSIDTLNAVKKSDNGFKDIDVESMAAQGNISITRNINVLASETPSTSSYREITYTITAKASCFSSFNQAKNFLSGIANTPVEYLEDMTIDYGVYLNNFETVDNYEKEVELLENQLKVLTSGYSSLISNYGDGVVIDKETGKTLYAYAHNVEIYVDGNELGDLLTRIQYGKLLKSESCKQSYELELIRIEEQLADATTTLETLKASDKAYLDGASVIKAQQDLVNELTRRRDLVKEFTDGVVDETFEDDIQKAYDTVKALTDEYAETSGIVYRTASSVVYMQPGIIEKVGEMSLSKVLIISVIVAVVIALIAAYVAGYYKLKALKRVENSKSNALAKEDNTIPLKENNEEK